MIAHCSLSQSTLVVVVVGQQLWDIQDGRFGAHVPADVVSIVASELGISADLHEFEQISRQRSVS